MRQIKFRAWDKREKGMIQNIHTCYDGMTCDKNVRVRFDSFPTDEIYKDEVEIMQFTGLKDKNDKEIYEGDIVKFNRKTPYLAVINNPDGDCFRVKYNGLNTLILGDDLKVMEVIGNIYENPELIK